MLTNQEILDRMELPHDPEDADSSTEEALSAVIGDLDRDQLEDIEYYLESVGFRVKIEEEYGDGVVSIVLHPESEDEGAWAETMFSRL